MKKSLSALNNAYVLFLFLFCVIHFIAQGQSKAVIDKKPLASISHSTSITAKKVKTHRHLRNKKQNTSKPRAFVNPSEDDKKLKEIKDLKSRQRGLK
jgi:hypothetical protein